MDIFDKLISIKNYDKTALVNMTCGFFALYLNKLFFNTKSPILVVTSNMYEANKIYQKVINDNCLLFQVDDIITNEKITSSPELKLERLNVLKELIADNNKIVITDINGYLKVLPSIKDFKSNTLELRIGQEYHQEDLINDLYSLGYNRETLVSQTGGMGVRGFVLDLFPVDYENPVRIEFFGDEIESIRYFNVDSQQSIENINKIKVYPFTEQITNNYSSIYDYLGNAIVIFKDYNQIKISYNRLLDDIKEFIPDSSKKNIFKLEEIKPKEYINYLDFDSNINDLIINNKIDYNTKSIDKFNGNFDKINMYLNNSLINKKTVIVCLSTINVNKFKDSLLIPNILTTNVNIYDNKINIINYPLNEGFSLNNYIILTENELFGSNKTLKRRKTQFKFSTKINNLSKLEIGDYVVHDLHGIGIYNGIKTLKRNDCFQDYLEILYAKGDKLYIPASKIELINKYTSKDGYTPKINSLNSVTWLKTKQRVKEKIKYEASRLLKVQAERALKKGFAFSKDIPMQLIFENEFPYEMTDDQVIATNQIKKDMENIVPMDRILCGDVGYGKTEVAFRAIFKAVCDSKQVLYLCPTTLLSNQQYEAALERFKNFPVKIGILNRFTTPKKTKEILDELENGTIDLVFGTHRLLSKDVKPKNLGLLVVDEEQRFGVAHKEKIKEFKSNIDVLTLTATPIPRTLQMAMLGLRNLSLIETPPKNRHAVQTYVLEENNQIIRDIIYKEISRNGQVFILYNKVSSIEEKVRLIKLLVPDAKVLYAHGQMSKNELEDRMNLFIHGDYNVLICTTIIETGIDIPNANSLIIYDADCFGLSQLYQIRGRVGRSDRIAYAYLMYNKGKVLTSTAMKRLKVIKEFTELGSGFKIASRDLSIRGAGDILGSEQAGFIDDVGIDLYMKMLEIEINKLKGINIEEKEEKEEKDEMPIIQVNSHIKDSYVKEIDLKIEIHKMINNITSFEKLDKTKKELEDRFGKLDDDMIIYMNEELFEYLVKQQQIIKVNENNLYIELIFSKEKSQLIKYDELFYTSVAISKNFNFNYKNDQLFLRLNKNNLVEHPLIYLNKLLQKM